MFFAYLTEFLIVLVFVWIMWKKIIKPVLESKGIEVEDEPEVITDHTKRLKKMKEEFKNKSASAQAATEGVELAKQIKDLEDVIKESDRNIKDVK